MLIDVTPLRPDERPADLARSPDSGSPTPPVPTWPTLVPALVLSVVYGCTVQRGTGNAFSIDTTKFEFVGRVLGTPHPPGYPLYTLLNAAFVRVVPIGSTALRANLLSAVFAVLTCVLMVSVLRSLGLPRPLAAGGATALGLLPVFWQDAVVAEVYSLTALFTVAVLACLLRYDATRPRGWLRAALLVFALSFAHTPATVFLLPGMLLYLVLRHPWWLLRPRELVTLLPLGALLALLPYAYLPWRTAVGGNTWIETQVFDLHSLKAALTGAQFGNRMGMVTWDVIRDDRLPVLAASAWHQLGPLLVLTAVGLGVLVVRRPVVAALTVAWVLATTRFVLSYAIDDWLTLLLTVWLVVALWTLVGVHACIALAGPRRRLTAVLVACALPLAALVHGYRGADQSGPDPQRAVDAAISAVPDGSLVFTPSVETRQQFVYRLLPDDLGLRRRVWAAEGSNHGGESGEAVFLLREYCSPSPGPWSWPWHEQPAAAVVPRGLHTFVYGSDYSNQVRAEGFDVRPVRGQLYAVACPALPPGTAPEAARAAGVR